MYYNTVDWEEREEELLQLLQNGTTYAEAGRHFGVTRQRIQQVVVKFGFNVSKIGRKIILREREAEYAKQQNLKWGNREDTDLYRSKRLKFFTKKTNAKRAGMEWNIPFPEIDFPTHCPILGIELNYFNEKTSEDSPSLGRIDSTKGYISGNVVVVSWRANRIKNDGTPEEHLKIYEYYSKYV